MIKRGQFKNNDTASKKVSGGGALCSMKTYEAASFIMLAFKKISLYPFLKPSLLAESRRIRVGG